MRKSQLSLQIHYQIIDVCQELFFVLRGGPQKTRLTNVGRKDLLPDDVDARADLQLLP
jgi:hypothetical protein